VPRATGSRATRSARAADGTKAPAKVAKRCGTCARFRAYEPGDAFCLVCGHEDLADACDCGRAYDYALGETGELHCPRCGKSLAGRVEGFEA
jgi:hypothetical protein